VEAELRKVAALMGAAWAVACSDGSTGPGVDPLTVAIGGGDAQVGVEGWPLAQPPTVLVTDAAGAPRSGVVVAFTVESGGGSVTASADTTSVQGTASTGWVLGSPAVRTQTLRVALSPGGESVTFVATSLGDGEADQVVVHGALGPLRGVVLVRGPFPLEVLAVRVAPDTLISFPPTAAPGTELIVFGSENRPRHVAPAWTSAIDTAHVALEPPVMVALDVDVLDGTFEVRRQDVEAQLREVEGIIGEESLGIAVGDVTYVDHTGGNAVSLSSSDLCAGPVPAGAIQVTVATAIDNGAYTGWGCWSGRIYLTAAVRNVPHLLAHELGHTFTLEHTETGLMRSANPQRFIRDGEIYRAHFHVQSTLNTIFGSQPEADRRNCSVAGSCLPETFELSPP